MDLPFGSVTVARPSRTKFQMQGQKNHQVVGCVRPFIAPLWRRMKTVPWTAATGSAKASPRMRGVRNDSATSRIRPTMRQVVGNVHLNASPRYPALSAAGMPAATTQATRAQRPAPASHAHTRRSVRRASSGAKTAPRERTQLAVRNRAIHAYFAGWMRGAKLGSVHVQDRVPPLRPSTSCSMVSTFSGVSANTVLASAIRATPASPMPSAP